RVEKILQLRLSIGPGEHRGSARCGWLRQADVAVERTKVIALSTVALSPLRHGGGHSEDVVHRLGEIVVEISDEERLQHAVVELQHSCAVAERITTRLEEQLVARVEVQS